MASELRIGLTMREVSAEGYNEPRDALARVWGEFLQVAVPEAAWLPVPNLGPASAPLFCDRWDINALILTGGEDMGVSPVRDATERGLLQHFARNGRPVFGVCRGLQLMWTEFGGDLEINGGHVAVRHHVRYARENALHIEDRIADVNSFHSFSLRESTASLRQPVIVFARADDGSAEGVSFGDSRMAGVMWHPEREQSANSADVSLIRSVFGLGAPRVA